MKRLQRFNWRLLALILLCGFMSCAVGAKADETVVTEDRTIVFKIGLSYYLLDKGDGIWQSCSMDVAPYVKNGRTYVPVRYLAEGLGIPNQKPYIDWEEKTKKVTVDGRIIKSNLLNLYIGKQLIFINGKKKDIDVAPEITKGRTMLPARYVLEGLGYTVQWDPANQLVICTRGNKQIDLQMVLDKIKELQPNKISYENDKIKLDYTGWPEIEECQKYGKLAVTKHMKIDKQAGTLTFDLPTAPKGSVWWIDVNYDDPAKEGRNKTVYDQFRKQIYGGKGLPVTKGGYYVLHLPFDRMTRCYVRIGLAKENNILDQSPSDTVVYDVLNNTYVGG